MKSTPVSWCELARGEEVMSRWEPVHLVRVIATEAIKGDVSVQSLCLSNQQVRNLKMYLIVFALALLLAGGNIPGEGVVLE